MIEIRIVRCNTPVEGDWNLHKFDGYRIEYRQRLEASHPLVGTVWGEWVPAPIVDEGEL